MRGAAVSEVYGNGRKLNTAPKRRGNIASCENNSKGSAELGGLGEAGLPTDPLAKGL